METVGIIGTIVVILIMGIIAGIWIYLRKKSKFTYKLRWGSRVWCQECEHMEKRKLDVEDEINRFMRLVSSRFEKQRMIEELEDLQIGFKKKPFSPEGWAITNAKLLQGVYISDRNLVIVYVGRGKMLRETALAHELLHWIMYKVDGILDHSHSMREFWKMIGE